MSQRNEIKSWNEWIIPMRRFWSEKEDKILKKLYPHMETIHVAKKLGRSIRAVHEHAYFLGIKKSDEFKTQHALRTLGNGSVRHRFKNGHVPHNKGKKMSQETYEKIKHTFFPKGHEPVQTKSDNFITLRHYTMNNGTVRSYWNIRIKKGKWKMYHVHIWERENGPVPEGYILVFKDRNSFNCVLENIEPITLAENMQRNTIHQHHPEIQKTIRLITKVKNKITMYAKEQN